MNKWYGKIGFCQTGEIEPGLWVEDQIIERKYFGDVSSTHWKRQNTSEKVNDNISLSNQISILADPYLKEHCSSIAYIEWMGEKWKVSDVEVQYPRLILSIGGVYK